MKREAISINLNNLENKAKSLNYMWMRKLKKVLRLNHLSF